MNNKTKNITLLIAIALTVLSFQVKAQGIGTYGCTDSTAMNYNSGMTVDGGNCVYINARSNEVHGYKSSAIFQLYTPTLNLIELDAYTVKYKSVDSTTWNVITVIMDLDINIHSGLNYTFDGSFWYFRARKLNAQGNVIADGSRIVANIRVNLQENTTYEYEMFFSQMGGSNISNVTSGVFTTGMSQGEAPENTDTPY